MTSLDPPADLPPEVRAIWTQTLTQLNEAGTLRHADPNSLHAYATAVHTHNQADQLINSSGVLLNVEGKPAPNPALAIRTQAATTIARFARQFRLNRPGVVAPHGAEVRMRGPRTGEARWCGQHAKWECTYPRKKARGPCHQPALTAWDGCRLKGCKLHIGMTVEEARARHRARCVVSQPWVAELPTGEEPGPREIMTGLMVQAWARSRLLGAALQEQAMAAAPGELPGISGVMGEGDGLVGHTWAMGEAGLYATGERERALVGIERAERDLAAKFAKLGHEMGIEERHAELEAATAGMFLRLVEGVVDRLGLSAEQRRLVPVVVPAVLAELAQ